MESGGRGCSRSLNILFVGGIQGFYGYDTMELATFDEACQ